MKALFLDRDGVINKEINYLHKIKDLLIFPGVISKLKEAKEKGYLIIVVTNQAGIAKGHYRESDFFKLTKYIEKVFKAGGALIDKTYYCPHHPDGKGRYKIICNCRKPRTGMIEQAKEDFDEIDLDNSIMVGDKEIDIQFGSSAGIGRLVLVRSGHLIDDKNTKANEIIEGLWDLKL